MSLVKLLNTSMMVNVMGISTDHNLERYGMNPRDFSFRLLDEIIDKFFIKNERVVPVAVEDLWKLAKRRRVLREMEEFDEAMTGLQKVELIEIIYVENVAVLVPTNKLVLRYDGHQTNYRLNFLS